ncbi:MAG TPA: ABC transporter transmembrane domain-containing protein, partial [Chthonomonadaceae bacterium]|nr:ABC transporter transmembrane domain-containing protein [Chthonomonadaceae bacterium]
MAEGVGGGWQGPERSLGGLSRTFGLHDKQIGTAGELPVKIEREQLRRVAHYFAPYGRQWLVIFLCIASVASLGVLPPLAVRGILDQAIPQRNMSLLLLYVGAIIGLTTLTGLIGVLQNYLNARVGESIIFDLRNALFQHLQKMSLPFYTTTRAGEIVSRINNDVAAVQSIATATLIAIVSNILTVIATVTVIFAMNWR